MRPFSVQLNSVLILFFRFKALGWVKQIYIRFPGLNRHLPAKFANLQLTVKVLQCSRLVGHEDQNYSEQKYQIKGQPPKRAKDLYICSWLEWWRIFVGRPASESRPLHSSRVCKNIEARKKQFMKKQNSLAQHEMINVLKWPVVPTLGRLGSGFSHALTAGSGAARLDGDQTSRNQRVVHLCCVDRWLAALLHGKCVVILELVCDSTGRADTDQEQRCAQAACVLIVLAAWAAVYVW